MPHPRARRTYLRQHRCGNCGRRGPLVRGRCAPCQTYQQTRYWQRRAARQCVQCGRTSGGKARCAACRQYMRDALARHQAHQEREDVA